MTSDVSSLDRRACVRIRSEIAVRRVAARDDQGQLPGGGRTFRGHLQMAVQQLTGDTRPALLHGQSLAENIVRRGVLLMQLTDFGSETSYRRHSRRRLLHSSV